MSQTTARSKERRAYFRLTDSVYFEYRVCSGDELEGFRNGGFQIPAAPDDTQTQLGFINRQINPLLGGIREANPEIAQFLDGMNRKLDLLVDQLFFNQFSKPNDSLTAVRTIDISEFGLSFSAKEALSAGEFIYARLVIVNFRLGLETYAEVKHCTATDNGGFRIGIELPWVSESERKQLARYLMTCQRDRRMNISAQSEKESESA